MRRQTGKGRYYDLVLPNGKKVSYVSVTTALGCIAKPALLPWACNLVTQYVRSNLAENGPIPRSVLEQLLDEGKRQHERVLETAGNFGSRVHSLIEERLLAGSLPHRFTSDPNIERCVELWESWWGLEELQPLQVEAIVYSIQHEFAGTADLIALDPAGQRVLGDWKTSNALRAEYVLQAVAYAAAWEEMHPDQPIHRIVVLRIGKNDGKLEMVEIAPTERDVLFDTFLCVLRLFQFQNSYRCRPIRIGGHTAPDGLR